MVETVRKMYEYATIPLIAKPNAGLPELDCDKTVYKTTPEEFAQDGRLLIEAGAHIVGGCCGTTPDHIRALHEAVCRLTPKAPHASHHRVLASERQVVEIKLDGSFQVIGERINPTGKKKLQAELRAGKLDMVRAMAREQERNGASILDVNMGTNGIDEKEMMLKAIYEVTGVSGLPLSIDTSSPDIMEAALRIYPGRPWSIPFPVKRKSERNSCLSSKSTAPCSSPCLFRITVSPRPSKKNMPSSTSSWPMPTTTLSPEDVVVDAW